jgi:acetyl-CoA C-acetyltransferase
MRIAVIVSTARGPIGRAYHGTSNAMQSQRPGGNVIARLVKRAGVDPSGVGNVLLCGRGDGVAADLSEVA